MFYSSKLLVEETDLPVEKPHLAHWQLSHMLRTRFEPRHSMVRDNKPSVTMP